MSKSLIHSVLSEAQGVLETFITNEENVNAIAKAGDIIVESLRNGNKIISCGNGGSMSDAMHFAEELTGRFREDRPSIPALAISDPSYLSCVANDYGYDEVFSRFVQGVGVAADVLLAISTSGNSPNVLKAAQKAKEKGMKVVALTGKDGGQLASFCDVEVRAPNSKYADRAQEIHIKVIHCLIEIVEQSYAA